MCYAIIGAGLMWGLVALPEVTNAGADFGVYPSLFLFGGFIGLLWMCYSAAVPGVFRMSRVRWLWLSVPLIGVGGLLLAVTHRDLAIRVWLCDSELREYAESVRQNPDGPRRTDQRVGLFVVKPRRADENQVELQTASGFLDYSGIVYRPDGTTPEYRNQLGSCRYQHLYGPWWSYYEIAD